jgi:hypothetical protein
VAPGPFDQLRGTLSDAVRGMSKADPATRGLLDLVKELLHDAIRIVKCPPWRTP